MTTENNKKESEVKTDETLINHIRNVKLLQAIYGGKKFFVECFPTDTDARHFPNSNFAVKEIQLPEFDLFEEKLGYKWVKEPAATPIEGEIKSKEAKDYIHLGIEFSQREQFKDSGASYISGVGFGYSCGYQDGEKAASQFTPTKEKEYREALGRIENICLKDSIGIEQMQRDFKNIFEIIQEVNR